MGGNWVLKKKKWSRSGNCSAGSSGGLHGEQRPRESGNLPSSLIQDDWLQPALLPLPHHSQHQLAGPHSRSGSPSQRCHHNRSFTPSGR